jgi:hypothetical protein
VTPAEEVRNIATADDAGSVEDVSAAVNNGAGKMATAQTDGSGAPPRHPGPDPWQALVQVGAQFIGALAAANNPNAAAHPWIERDPATGAQILKMPLPRPETARQLADAFSALADSLRGRLARRAAATQRDEGRQPRSVRHHEQARRVRSSGGEPAGRDRMNR